MKCAWPASSLATTASTSLSTTASTESPVRNADDGTLPGASRTDAEAIAATLVAAASPPADAWTRSLKLERFLTEQWIPRRRTHLRATTTHRSEWMIDNYRR